MMMKTLLPVLFCSPFLLTACAHKPPPRPVEEDMFVTNIKDSGAKIFRFSMATAPTDEPRGEGPGQRSGGRKGPPPGASQSSGSSVGNAGTQRGDSYSKKREALYARLNEKLTNTQYCREGFIEIDTYEALRRFYLLGECNESATEQDKQNFANTYRYD